MKRYERDRADGSLRPSPPAGRRFGYLVAVVVNMLLLGAVNVWPGWEAVPFLTFDTRRVVGVLNASLVAAIAVNLAYLVLDARWFKAFGDLVVAGFSLVFLVQLWRVFPFAFSTDGLEIAIQALLGVAVFGVVIGMLASLATLSRAGR